MKTLELSLSLLALIVVGILSGCSGTSAKSRDVSDGIRTSLNQARLRQVSISQDRDKGVVTLGGHVTIDVDKAQAEAIAGNFAGKQVVTDPFAVIPLRIERDAKAVNSDLDQGIEQNLDAALIQDRMDDSVKYDLKNGVATLAGEVSSKSRRAKAEKVASSIPSAQQVGNELRGRDQKVSSSY